MSRIPSSPRAYHYPVPNSLSPPSYTTMAARPLNDDEVLSEMNKMVRSVDPFSDTFLNAGGACLGCFHQTRSLGKGSRDQSQGRRRVCHREGARPFPTRHQQPQPMWLVRRVLIHSRPPWVGQTRQARTASYRWAIRKET